MKIKPGFRLRVVCGENVVVAEGKENIDFNNIIRLNETAAAIWKAVQEKEFTVDDMVAALMEEYEVDKETATKDCTVLAKSWGEAGMLVGTEPKQNENSNAKGRTRGNAANNKAQKTSGKPITNEATGSYAAKSEEKNESFIGKICRSIKNLFK